MNILAFGMWHAPLVGAVDGRVVRTERLQASKSLFLNCTPSYRLHALDTVCEAYVHLERPQLKVRDEVTARA